MAKRAPQFTLHGEGRVKEKTKKREGREKEEVEENVKKREKRKNRKAKINRCM